MHVRKAAERETWVVQPYLGCPVTTAFKGERRGCMPSLGFPLASPDIPHWANLSKEGWAVIYWAEF